MKKFIFSLSALAALLLAGSCQRENLEPVEQGGTVTYTVQVPGALATKAADDFKLIYEVYREDNTLIYESAEPIPFGQNGKVELSLEFVKDQNFTVLFWAQKDGAAYNTGDLRNVTLGTLTANQENYEVFAGKDDVTSCVSSNDGNVVLVRPIAQLNIATLTSGLTLGNTVSSSTVKPEYSDLKVTGLYSAYNVATGEVIGDAGEVSYVKSAIKANDIFNPDYTRVGMNYVGFMPKEGANVEVDFNIYTEKDGDISHKVSNVPVKPNYKTNIIGNLISATADYQVTLGAWGTPDTNVEVVAVSTAQDLQEAIDNIQTGAEGNIILEGDIDLGALAGMISTKAAAPTCGLQIPAGKSLVLDLNGNTLAQTVNQTGAYSMIQNNGNLTIVDSKGTGKIAYGDTGNGGNYVSNTIVNNGKLVIESGLIENNSSADVASNGYPHPVDNNGELIINGGTLTNNAHYASMRIWCTTDDNTSVTINGGTFNGSIDFQTPNAAANKGSLTITGGTFNADTYTNCAVRLLGFGADVDEMLGYINGGTFKGEIALRNWSGAELNSQVFYITGGQFSVDPSAFVVDGYPVVDPKTEGGYFTIGEYTTVAKIGDQEYGSLRAAVAAVEDGGIITLVANETFTKANRYNNGGYWDGLGYSGDKSFTIDLGGHTISQNGALNDYLVWIKNVGSKENTITFKNGTMDAGKTAYCALCTASSHENKLTVNLENITLINENSNGSTVKIRAGSVLNVKAGTKITGKNSYLGVENWNAVVNIYDGAEIYMNGTTSYNGCLVGVGGNGTVNVYGGYGKGVSGGLIAMTSGGTINAMGGEWIANTDGTFANSNKSVLVAQSDKQYNAGAGNAVVNVTGGTYKGGYNCYGNAVGDAQINISGGNFNADPSAYLEDACEATENAGVWTVRVLPAAKIGETEYASLQEAFNVGGNITLLRDVTVSETATLAGGKTAVLDLNGKTLTANLVSALASTEGANLTVKNGKVVAYESTVRAIGGKVIIESGEYTSTGTAAGSPATNRYSLDCREGGELIINGGTFKSNNGMINVGSTVTINGGKFENIVEKSKTRHFAYVSAPLTINDGEFYGKANSSAGGCFFCGAAAGGKVQVNGGKFTSLWTSGSVNRIFEVYFGGTINVTGGMFNTNGGIATFVTENTDDATKAAYPYVAK